MVDPARVRRLLDSLRRYRDGLQRLRDLPVQEYVDEHAFEGRYLVQVAAQVCIDLASHAISSEGWRVPTDFRDAFTVLQEKGVIDAPLTERLRDLAGLRNRLVHVYEEVDDRIVHGAIGGGLRDLDEFARSIARIAGQRAAPSD